MVYENIKALSDKKGICITALEKEAKLGRGTIGKWRTVSPRLSNLEQVANALNVSVKTLLK